MISYDIVYCGKSLAPRLQLELDPRHIEANRPSQPISQILSNYSDSYWKIARNMQTHVQGRNRIYIKNISKLPILKVCEFEVCAARRNVPASSSQWLANNCFFRSSISVLIPATSCFLQNKITNVGGAIGEGCADRNQHLLIYTFLLSFYHTREYK